MVATFGIHGDILNIFHFDWYDWWYFCEEGNIQFPLQILQLVRVLKPMNNGGNNMAQSVLKTNVKVVLGYPYSLPILKH